MSSNCKGLVCYNALASVFWDASKFREVCVHHFCVDSIVTTLLVQTHFITEMNVIQPEIAQYRNEFNSFRGIFKCLEALNS